MIKHIFIGLRFATFLVLGAGLAQGALAADPAGSSPTSSSISASTIDAVLKGGKKSGGDDFLPVDEAFRFSAFPDGADHVKLVWQIADGYYLYRARVKVSTTSQQAQLGAL